MLDKISLLFPSIGMIKGTIPWKIIKEHHKKLQKRSSYIKSSTNHTVVLKILGGIVPQLLGELVNESIESNVLIDVPSRKTVSFAGLSPFK